MSLVVVDLFCGAGGVSEGLRSLGVESVGWDIDADACDTHGAAGHPTIQVDLSTFDWEGQMADVVHASPPCQPFSTGGKENGAADERDCMPDALRAVEALEPSLVTIENVASLTWPRHRAYLDQFCIDLVCLGYWVEWRVLNAADFGVPQERERLWIVAVPDGETVLWPVPTHGQGSLGTLFEQNWVTINDVLHREGWSLNTGMDWKKGEPRSKAQTRSCDRPAPTVGTRSGSQWRWQRGTEWEAITRSEVAQLQGFRPDYPWHGKLRSQDRQIGNAVPPAMAAAVLGPNLARLWANNLEEG